MGRAGLHDFPEPLRKIGPITGFSIFPKGRGVLSALEKVEAFSLQFLGDEAILRFLLFFWNHTPIPLENSSLLTSASSIPPSHPRYQLSRQLLSFRYGLAILLAGARCGSFHNPYKGHTTTQDTIPPYVRKTSCANFRIEYTKKVVIQSFAPGDIRPLLLGS